eukprot:8606223-Lingulodinium_polyedra.AAC.1
MVSSASRDHKPMASTSGVPPALQLVADPRQIDREQIPPKGLFTLRATPPSLGETGCNTGAGH